MIMYRSDSNSISVCQYDFTPDSTTIVCNSDQKTWGGALEGTSAAAFVDEDGFAHFFYQMDVPLDIGVIESLYGGQSWTQCEHLPHRQRQELDKLTTLPSQGFPR